jgi:polyisoprenoid-binding protein YceI
MVAHMHAGILRALVLIAGGVFAAAGVAPSLAAPGPVRQHRLDVQHSTMTVHVFKSGLLRGFGDNHLIQGDLTDGWIDDSGTMRVDVLLDAHRLRVLDPGASAKDREAVQARMLGPEVLDAERFPFIRFGSTVVVQLDRDRWEVRGSLELHGRTHDVRLQVVREDGHYRGQTTLRQTDFGITPVSVAGGLVKVKDELAIDFDIVTRDGQASGRSK